MARKRLRLAVVVGVLVLGGVVPATAQTGPIVITSFAQCAVAADQTTNCWQVQVVQAPPGSLPPPDG